MALTTFGISELTDVGDWFYVGNNGHLESFDLASLSKVGGNFGIEQNISLASCLVEALVEQVQTTGGIWGEVGSNFYNNQNCTCEEAAGELVATCP